MGRNMKMKMRLVWSRRETFADGRYEKAFEEG